MEMDPVLLEKMNDFLDSEYASDESIAVILELLDVVDNDTLNEDDLRRLKHDTEKYEILISTLDLLTAGTPPEELEIFNDDPVVSLMEQGYATKNT